MSPQVNFRSLALLLAAAAALPLVTGARAAEDAPESDAPERPASVVLESRNTVIQEHRRGGEVYLIEVQKRNAGSYVLIDRDGQGQRESRSTDLENDVDTAKWSLFRW
jgi:hypothetical protein